MRQDCGERSGSIGGKHIAWQAGVWMDI